MSCWFKGCLSYILLDLLHLPGSEILVQDLLLPAITPLLTVMRREKKEHITLDYGSEGPTVVRGGVG